MHGTFKTLCHDIRRAWYRCVPFKTFIPCNTDYVVFFFRFWFCVRHFDNYCSSLNLSGNVLWNFWSQWWSNLTPKYQRSIVNRGEIRFEKQVIWIVVLNSFFDIWIFCPISLTVCVCLFSIYITIICMFYASKCRLSILLLSTTVPLYILILYLLICYVNENCHFYRFGATC